MDSQVNPGKTNQESPKENRQNEDGKSQGNQGGHEKSRRGVAGGKAKLVRWGDETPDTELSERPRPADVLLNEIVKDQFHSESEDPGNHIRNRGRFQASPDHARDGAGIAVGTAREPEEKPFPG